MIRLATTLAAFALAASAPAASAQGFREPEVRAALEARGLGAIADTIAPAARPALIVDRTLLPREPEELGHVATRRAARPPGGHEVAALPRATPRPSSASSTARPPARARGAGCA